MAPLQRSENMELLVSSDPALRRRGILALARTGNDMYIDAIAPLLAGDPDRDVRLDAVQALAGLPGFRATWLLLEKAASNDAVLVRVAALEALERRKDPHAASGLIDLWRKSRNEDDAVIHIGARKALIDTGRAVVPELLRALRDPCASVREFSLEVLAKVGDCSLKDEVLPLTRDSERLVRWAAENTLNEIQERFPPAN
jgi:HEAT repeat protein